METQIESCINAIEIQNSFINGRMEVIPLFSSQETSPEYLTLGEALEQDLIVVTEVSREGSVPQLAVKNRGTTPVLLIDGEELAGAKQNRVLNTSILVPGQSEIAIPVSCTEHGRWSYKSPVFHDSRVMMDFKIRAKKMASVGRSMKERKSRVADQVEIWNEIADLSSKVKVASPTGAMRDVYTSKVRELNGYVGVFPLQPGQHGALVYIDGRVAGIEFLSRPEAYARIHDKLIRSYVVEALIEEESPAAPPEKPEHARDFLTRVAACPAEEFSGVGLGTELRMEGKDLVGSALVHGGVVVHLACFARDPASGSLGREMMAGYRTRRDSQAARNRQARTGRNDNTIVW